MKKVHSSYFLKKNNTDFGTLDSRSMCHWSFLRPVAGSLCWMRSFSSHGMLSFTFTSQILHFILNQWEDCWDCSLSIISDLSQMLGYDCRITSRWGRIDNITFTSSPRHFLTPTKWRTHLKYLCADILVRCNPIGWWPVFSWYFALIGPSTAETLQYCTRVDKSKVELEKSAMPQHIRNKILVSVSYSILAGKSFWPVLLTHCQINSFWSLPCLYPELDKLKRG